MCYYLVCKWLVKASGRYETKSPHTERSEPYEFRVHRKENDLF